MNSGLLYEQVADDLTRAIRAGTLRGGDRMPSVRGLAKQRHVSVATILQAYVRLENDGLIEVRPRSGHFVRHRSAMPSAEPRMARLNPAPATVSVTPGVRSLMQSMRDPSVVPLGAAQVSPSLLPIRQLNRRLSAIAREVQDAGASYGDPNGLPTLRRQLSKLSVTWGMPIHESEFVVTIGAMEAIHLALRAVARAGDTIAVETPTYFGILQAIELLGMKAVEVPAHVRTGLDLDALEQVLRQGHVRAVLASPNVSNPLGAVMPDEHKERLVKLCARYDAPLIEDDVYGDLAFESRPRPAAHWDREGRVLLIGSVSKTLAPGYRIGWIAPGRYQERIERLKYALTVSTPPLLQMAVAEFLGSGGYERHVRKLRSHLHGQVDRTRQAVIDAFPEGTRISDPAGGFVLWVELPPHVDAYELQAAGLAEKISVAPGPVFSPRERFTNFIRISCGFPWNERTAKAIRTLGRLAHELQRAPRRSA
ncbi:MAG: GntR family transcriptional regulator [Archangium gephyra]|uniref:GntR family transcriptional regulator n=1 Tax=Archangium gephyra TaxID=48 RepID=A0A2W5TEP0_9BACT|nr:MAG: GntR family transcriptional regulator [Archangium gephyra]